MPYVTFNAAVVMVAFLGGRNAGLAATFAGALICDYFIIPPRYVLALKPAELVAMGLYCATGVVVSVLAGRMRAARSLAEAGAQELRERAEELQRERSLLQSITRATDVMLVYLDRQFNFVSVNEAYARTCGLQPEAMIGKNHFALYPHAENEAIFRRVRDTGEGAFFKDKPFEFPDQPGRGITYWDWSLVPVLDGAGRVAGLVFSLRETTPFKLADLKRRETEDSLRKSEEIARRHCAEIEAIYDSIDVGLAVLDRDLRFVRVNRKMAELNGRPVQDHIGRTVREIVPDLSAQAEAAIQKIVETGQPIRDLELTGMTEAQPGVRRTWNEQWIPLKDGQGGIVGINVSAVEVTRERETQQALETANKSKDDFLAVLSHELRTPLTPVLASVSLLRRREDLGPEALEDLDLILRNVELQARLIDDLLDVSRIARGKLVLNRRPIELNSVIARAVEVVRPEAQAKQQRIDVETGPGRHLVDADAARLQQAFWNLLRNAVKFTPRGGWIRVRCWLDGGGHAVVEVRDNGEGIDPGALGRIFNAFEQAEPLVTRRFGGLGLGLAISRSLVEMHGGTIDAQSEGKGKGAVFCVRLPVATFEPHREVPASAPSAAASRPLRILLVEDHADTARVMRRLLAQAGHDVTHAGDASVALDWAARQPFDLLISDLGLPGRSGLDLMRELRAHGRAIPGIALSGYGQDEDVRRSLEAGFKMHVTKPVAPDALADAVVRAAEPADFNIRTGESV